MQTVCFIGRIFPETVRHSIHLPPFDWKWHEHDFTMRFEVTMENSSVHVEVMLPEFKREHFNELAKISTDLARTAANVEAFATGNGVTFLLERFIDPDGVSHQINNRTPSYARLCKSYGLTENRRADLDAVTRILLNSPDVFLALNDLVEAISQFHVAPLRCALAVERLKHVIADDDKLPDARSWEIMRRALNVSETYLKRVTDLSRVHRHGKRDYIRGDDTHDVAERAWVVMDRFFEYCKRGKQPLPESEFPVVT